MVFNTKLSGLLALVLSLLFAGSTAVAATWDETIQKEQEAAVDQMNKELEAATKEREMILAPNEELSNLPCIGDLGALSFSGGLPNPGLDAFLKTIRDFDICEKAIEEVKKAAAEQRKKLMEQTGINIGWVTKPPKVEKPDPSELSSESELKQKAGIDEVLEIPDVVVIGPDGKAKKPQKDPVDNKEAASPEFIKKMFDIKSFLKTSDDK